MPKLPLAVDIADLVNKAAKSDRALDPARSAEHLLAKHPEASDISHADVAIVVSEEYRAAVELAAQHRNNANPILVDEQQSH
ncbi:hypothetical protein [Rhodoligotrophos defluvii]|uniref:hypothetical protein n=1 Tax=Rhodoligotrophos defluvii TaxID=2561934 RepID=UPI0010C9C037|nr:hypothetical protein [Rhodoligotrophos defluvii]